MYSWNDIRDWLISGLFQNFVWFLVGVLFVYIFWDRLKNWRYGRWVVILKRGGEIILRRRVSPEKARDILADASDKAVFLKGIVSPYAYLNCDVVEVGPGLGLLRENKKARQWIIDLDKNPQGGPQATGR
jgi:hypothetical protein